MQLSPVLLAIPAFFILMALEVTYETLWAERKTYRLNDAMTNISTGILNQLTGVFVKVVTVGVYVWVYSKSAFLDLPTNGWSFAAAFIVYDLCYYWSHRMAHEVSLFWGGHVVHHQSEEYNLSVALRQSATSFLWSMPFYLPMALVGFDPMQFLLAGGLNLVYQFWIHTDHIGKLGPIEWVMNTPSHHRVHHGKDPKYIDKNYAGVFIIWDRLFGTFQVEEERPNYGITKPLNSWNPVYANLSHYRDLARLSLGAQGLGELVGILFGKPGAVDASGSIQETRTGSPGKFNHHVGSTGWSAYLGIQFMATVALTAFFLFRRDDWSMGTQGIAALWVVYSLLVSARMLTQVNAGIVAAETVRLLLLIAVVWALGQPETHLIILSIWSAVSLTVFLVVYRKRHTFQQGTSSHAERTHERPVRATRAQER